MKIIILGAGGFIGNALLHYLSKNESAEITACDISFNRKFDDTINERIANKTIKIIKGDFTIQSEFQKLDNKYDQLYMLASIVGVNNCIDQPHEVIRVNISLILNTLNWLTRVKVGKLLFTSTSECYAGAVQEFNYNVPTSEEVPVCISDISHPRFTYAATKILGESAFINYARKYSFNTTVIRYQNIYGPNMGFKHVIPHLFERFYNKEIDFKIYGPNQTRAFCYISDAIQGTVKAMASDLTNGEIYHIGRSDEITIKKLVEIVGEMMGYTGSYIDKDPYPGSVGRRSPDITKAINHFSYHPKIDIKTGLIETKKWYLNYLVNNKIEIDGFKPPEIHS